MKEYEMLQEKPWVFLPGLVRFLSPDAKDGILFRSCLFVDPLHPVRAQSLSKSKRDLCPLSGLVRSAGADGSDGGGDGEGEGDSDGCDDSDNDDRVPHLLT